MERQIEYRDDYDLCGRKGILCKRTSDFNRDTVHSGPSQVGF